MDTAQLMGGYMTGCFDRRLFCRFYPEVDTFHNDCHSDQMNDLQIHLGVYPDLHTGPATNLLLLSRNSPSVMRLLSASYYLLAISPWMRGRSFTSKFIEVCKALRVPVTRSASSCANNTI